MPDDVLCCLKALDPLVWPCAGRQDVKLLSVSINGKAAPKDSYEVSSEGLTLRQLPAGSFDLETEVQINPKANTSLEGLYYTGARVCGSCWAAEAVSSAASGSLALLCYLDDKALCSMHCRPGCFNTLASDGPMDCLQRQSWHRRHVTVMAVDFWGVVVHCSQERHASALQGGTSAPNVRLRASVASPTSMTGSCVSVHNFVCCVWHTCTVVCP